MVFKARHIWIFIMSIIIASSFIGDLTIYAILSFFVAIFLICSTAYTSRSLKDKVALSFLYIVLFIGQVAFYSYMPTTQLNEVVASFLIFVSFATESYFNSSKRINVYSANLNEKNLSFEDIKLLRQKVRLMSSDVLQKAGKMSPSVIKEILEDIPRHSSIRYINSSSLSDEFFQNAHDSLSEPYIYIICSDTGSAASSLISVFTKKTYNHISIAFDEELKTLISYNGGEKISPPGLNYETIEWFYKKADSSILIYRLAVSQKQKIEMIDIVDTINKEGSAYNLIGLLTNTSFRPNIMFCSQFVYGLLKKTNCLYFEKSRGSIRPTDFIELDYERKLELVQKISFADDLKNETHFTTM